MGETPDLDLADVEMVEETEETKMRNRELEVERLSRLFTKDTMDGKYRWIGPMIAKPGCLHVMVPDPNMVGALMRGYQFFLFGLNAVYYLRKVVSLSDRTC
jgi:hypothetical protein